MKTIVEPVAKELLEQELTADRFVRKTNNGNNQIYILTAQDSPNLMREIGRLREFTFRQAGGGTGKEIDIDEFDEDSTAPYKQLIVWDSQAKEIIGGYRFIKCKEAPISSTGVVRLATTELFQFSDKFIKEYLPYTIELGRSFVQPNYQPSVDNRKGLFSLDNLWDGLGAIVVDNPDVAYFFGKVTMYTDYTVAARDMILSFMNYYFPDPEKLVIPIAPLSNHTDTSSFLESLKGLNYKEGHLLLNKNVRALGEHIPPLVNAYMNLSATMKTFGTAINTHFGEVEETGILVKFADIYDTKKERHISTYHPVNKKMVDPR